MLKVWLSLYGHGGLWSKVIALFGVSAALIVSVFMYASLQTIENKRNAESIYKLNQQLSVVRHIAVLAQYFDVERTRKMIAKNEDVSVFLLPTRQLEISRARNELRDLGRQLEFITGNLYAQKEFIPGVIQTLYFMGEQSTHILLKEYIASAYKLSQLSSDNQPQVRRHIEVISTHKNIIGGRLQKTVTLYYHYLGELVGQQNKNYWHYLVVVMVLFSAAMFFFILRPLQKDIDEAYEQAALANRIKTEFLTSVSHEIRTPMHGIISAGENLDTTRLDSKQKSYVRTIMSSADSLLDVVNDILGFSSLEAGETQVELARFNLFELTGDLVQIMEERAQLKKLELIMRYEDGVPHEVGGDASLIRQILYHLLSNSIKFTESGYIVVTVDIAEPLATGDLALKFLIEDTGIGIEESKLSIIFEQFVQGNGGTKRLFSGTGLGLSICKKLVELMGGSIRVGSVIGEGATFSFIIPVNVAGNAQRVDVQAVSSYSGSIVLICDDKEFKGSVLADLGMSGLQVVCKTSQELMTNTLHLNGPVSLLVVDYFVKAASPSKIIQTAKEFDELSGARIACITRKHDKQAAKNLTDQGYDGIFSFPADTELFTDFLMAKPSKEVSLQRVPNEPKPRAYTDNVNYLDGAEILLVEDNRINAALAEDMLLDFGASVTLAENGKIAVDYVRSGRKFDLVLMDCMMPVMDGFESTQAIRALPQVIGNALPIIALTANAMAGDRERCLDSGMNAYLSKPVRKKDLQQTMSKWLQHRTPVAKSSPIPPRIEETVSSEKQNLASKNHPSSVVMPPPSEGDASVNVGEVKQKTMLGMEADDFEPPLSINAKNSISAETEKLPPSDAPLKDSFFAPDSIPPKTVTATADVVTVPPVSQGALSSSSSSVNAKDKKDEVVEPPVGLVLQYLDQVAVVKAKSMMKRRFPTMIEYFLEDTQNYLEQIKQGLEEHDYKQLVVPSHTIKSSSRQMGAFTVSDLAREIEALARTEESSFETLLALTEQLQEQFDLSRIDFNYLLSEAG